MRSVRSRLFANGLVILAATMIAFGSLSPWETRLHPGGKAEHLTQLHSASGWGLAAYTLVESTILFVLVLIVAAMPWTRWVSVACGGLMALVSMAAAALGWQTHQSLLSLSEQRLPVGPDMGPTWLVAGGLVGLAGAIVEIYLGVRTPAAAAPGRTPDSQGAEVSRSDSGRSTTCEDG